MATTTSQERPPPLDELIESVTRDVPQASLPSAAGMLYLGASINAGGDALVPSQKAVLHAWQSSCARLTESRQAVHVLSAAVRDHAGTDRATSLVQVIGLSRPVQKAMERHLHDHLEFYDDDAVRCKRVLMLATGLWKSGSTQCGELLAALPALEWKLSRIAARYFRWKHDIDDVVQDVWSSITASLKRYDVTVDAWPWMATICRRKAIDRFRMAMKHKLVDENAQSVEWVSDVATEDLRTALQSLSSIELHGIELRFAHGCSMKQIAELLYGDDRDACRIKATRLLREAISKLRRQLGAEDDQ